MRGSIIQSFRTIPSMVTVMSRGLSGITYRLLVVVAIVLFLAEADTVDLFSLSKLTIWNMCVAIIWY